MHLSHFQGENPGGPGRLGSLSEPGSTMHLSLGTWPLATEPPQCKGCVAGEKGLWSPAWFHSKGDNGQEVHLASLRKSKRCFRLLVVRYKLPHFAKDGFFSSLGFLYSGIANSLGKTRIPYCTGCFSSLTQIWVFVNLSEALSRAMTSYINKG